MWIESATAPQVRQLAEALVASAGPLRSRPIEAIVAVIAEAALCWRDPGSPERLQAEERLPALIGYSRPMVAHVLDRMAQDWTAERLWSRLEAEFGDPLVLDGWRSCGTARSRVLGPRLIWHVCAGNVAGVAIQSLIDGLLVKAPALVKPAGTEPLLAGLFAERLIALDPTLASSIAVVGWSGGSLDHEAAVLNNAEAVIVNGSSATVADIRRRAGAEVPVLGYGSRLSFALLGDLGAQDIGDLAARLAYDIALFDQSGCVSPHYIVIDDPKADVGALARDLNRALAAQERDLPRGSQTEAQALLTRRLRETAEWRGLAGEATESYGPDDGRWAVVVDPTALLGPGCGGRTIILRQLAAGESLRRLIAPIAPFLQSVGLSVAPERSSAVADELASLGVTRITTPGRQGWPHATWHHDGRSPLRSLVRWIDWESSE